MAQTIFFLQTSDGDFLYTADGDQIAILGEALEVLLTFFKDLRAIIIGESYVPSTKASAFDEERGRRVHRQFWLSGRLVGSESVSQAADNTWEITVTMAWQAALGRSDEDFGLFEMLDSVASMNNAIQSRMCAVWDEPVKISSASPEWDEGMQAWIVAITIETQERRSWAPTS